MQDNTDYRHGQIATQKYEIQFHALPKDTHKRISDAFKKTFMNDFGVNTMLTKNYKGDFSVNIESNAFMKDTGAWRGKTAEWKALKYNCTGSDGRTIVPSTVLRVEEWLKT
ncbi:MAG: hypothetical protein LQ337_007889 [Flavoplaca oasis]|nr:MAG: hypothetical protein LQ337_007889 [Flavoplaca oasis]